MGSRKAVSGEIKSHYLTVDNDFETPQDDTTHIKIDVSTPLERPGLKTVAVHSYYIKPSNSDNENIYMKVLKPFYHS